jgi:hypothetical protein
MRAEQFSGYEGLKLVDLPKPVVSDGKVLLRMTAAGVTPLEILHACADSDRWRCGHGRLGSRRPHSGARTSIFVFALAVSARQGFR